MLARPLLRLTSAPCGALFSDEFDGPLSSAWTVATVAGPSGNASLYPAVVDSNSTLPGMLYIKAQNDTYGYVYRSAPAPPFTVTALIAASALVETQPADVALCVGNPTTGFIQIMNPSSFSGNVQNVETATWSDLGHFLNSFDEGPLTPGYGGPHSPAYIRLVVASASDVSAYFSFGGMLYAAKWTHRNPTAVPQDLSVFNPSHIIFAVHPGVGQTAEAGIEWLHVTCSA